MKKILKKIGILSSFCLVLMVMAVLLLANSGREQQKTTEVVVPSKTIIRDGAEYFPRQDITVVMVLGIDKYGEVQSSGYYQNDGDADMVALLIFDEQNHTVKALCLNRDTMVEMPVLGLHGKAAGTAYQQLTLSHTYGNGLEESCENTKTTVSNLLNGIRIDYYLSMNMDAITILNDAVGGVKVQVTEDFSQVDSSIGRGEVTLWGEQAIHYVRTRKDVGDQLNITRMQRQKQYIFGLLEAVRQRVNESESFALSTYTKLSPYVVTDISSNVFSSMMHSYADYELDGILIPEGENVMGREYYEFYVDEEKLDQLVIELFYSLK